MVHGTTQYEINFLIYNTVKPVLRGHPWDQEKVTL
jgi:hypothetical protein